MTVLHCHFYVCARAYIIFNFLQLLSKILKSVNEILRNII